MRTVDYGDAEWFLNMVKSTHNKLKTGEVQSSQRRILSLEDVHARSVTLERPGDVPRKKQEEGFDVVAKHAEIMRNRECTSAAENSGLVAPGQGGPGPIGYPAPGQVPP